MSKYHSSNNRREIINTSFYNVIFQGVIEKIKRQMTSLEKDKTVTFINDMDPDLFKPELKTKTVTIMIKTLSDEFVKYDCKMRNDSNDIQEELRRTIGTTSESNTSQNVYSDPNYAKTLLLKEESQNQQPLKFSDPVKMARVFNPESFFRKNYIVLDSRYRIIDNNGSINSFKWVYNLGSQISTQGGVSAIGNVREIIAMKVYPFRIPYVESADNKYSRISVLLNNFSAQAFISNENRKFHFMLQSQIDSDFIDLNTDNFNDGCYQFENPVTTANTIEVSFGSPLSPILFDNDRDACLIDYFSITPLTKITTTLKHNLANGNQVYFSNFTVGIVNPLLTIQQSINEAIKNNINKTEGFLITVIDDYSFSIDYDSSAIQNPVARTFDVYYGSKRIFMPIEFTFIMPES